MTSSTQAKVPVDWNPTRRVSAADTGAAARNNKNTARHTRRALFLISPGAEGPSSWRINFPRLRWCRSEPLVGRESKPAMQRRESIRPALKSRPLAPFMNIGLAAEQALNQPAVEAGVGFGTDRGGPCRRRAACGGIRRADGRTRNGG